ncbi:MAG: HTTM domain-containing protein [Bacteroidia bacterium]
MKEVFKKLLIYNIPVAPLITFRILFGAATFFSTLRFILLGWVDLHFVNTKIQFKYYGFEWVKLFEPNIMYALHIVMLLSSIGIILGFFYRLSAVLFFFIFSYCELIDLTYYLNHYYFVSLAAFLLCWLPANASHSVDVLINPKIYNPKVPAWTINIIKFQLLCVYFYAGIAKINSEWLFKAMPLKIWLPANDTLPVIGSLFKYSETAYIFSWAGMLFDVTIAFWLVNKNTRFWAWLVVVFFHAVTGAMFQIGVFPLVMIVGTLIFFGNTFHYNFLNLLFNWLNPKQTIIHKNHISYYQNALFKKAALVFFATYILFQLVFPLRCYAYPGNMYWTEQGYRFGWRVMLMEKAGTATFYVTDATTGKEGIVDNNDFLNPHQEKQMAMQPDMILQYAQFLKNHYNKNGLKVNKVRAEVYVTYNARPSKLLFDPNLNLLEIKDSWNHKDWILPLE